MPIGDQVGRGPDDVTRRLTALEQAQNALTALAGSAKAIAAAVQTGLGNLATSGTTWAGPVASPSTVSATGAITGGSVSSGADVSASGDLHGTNIYATAAPGYNITGGRVAGWWETATGRGGTASSSQRFKTALQSVDVDERAKAILQIAVGYFEYLAEIAKRDDPTSADYVGPDYHVSVNLGAIAEQLHALGLWEWVVYERNEDQTLRLDDAGEPIPYAIHDILIGWAALIAVQHEDKRLAALEAWAATQGFTASAE